nr:MAG TPA: 4Fe-4S single cluster domain protein [Caudoviricetes sp.]
MNIDVCPSGAATIVWWLPLGHYFCVYSIL